MSLEVAPIALFVYNRPKHTQRTVDSLRMNNLAQQSDLFVFSDGPKNEAGTEAVEQVRRYIRRIDGFQTVTIIERELNLGLANSVICGVTQLCNEFGRVIAVEDDLLTTPDFLKFINQSLTQYKSEGRVWSVSGFNFALEPSGDYRYDALFSYRSSSWGWGTWRDRWEKVDWEVSDYLEFRADPAKQRLFNRGGEDLTHLLDLQMAGRADSWAIRWAYGHFKHGGVALLPAATKVYNIGLDRSGVNCGPGSARQAALAHVGDCEYRFPNSVEPDAYLVAEIRRMCRPSLPRKFARQCRDKLRLMGLIS